MALLDEILRLNTTLDFQIKIISAVVYFLEIVTCLLLPLANSAV